MRQVDLLSFAEGSRLPPRGGEDEGEEDLGGVVPGSRCSRCGKPLRGGGLKVIGWPGRVCWNCYHKPMGRRDGRGDASRAAAAERNCRGKAYKRRR